MGSKNRGQWYCSMGKAYGGTLRDYLYDGVPTDEGGYLLARITINASGEKSANSKGSYDYWVIKVDGSQNHWGRQK